MKYLRDNVDPIFAPMLEALLESRPAKEDVPAFVKKYLAEKEAEMQPVMSIMEAYSAL